MSSETRRVRPFAIPRTLADVLSKAVLRFGSDTCEAGGRVTILDPELHVRKRAEIHWTPDDESFGGFRKTLAEGAAADGFDRSALALLVIAATPYLKITNVVHQASCENLDSMARVVALTEPDRPEALCAPHHGATVDIFLVLSRGLDRRSLRPWRRGTWLARETFRIATEQSQRLFHPKPLDDETRMQFGLPRKTMRYVRMDDVDPLESYDVRALDLYVDRELLDNLSARSRAPVSQAIQLQFAHDVIAAIVHAAAARESELKGRTWTDLGDSLLARVLRIAAKAGASQEQLLREVTTDPAKVIAHAEAALDVLLRTREAVRDGES
ncbi:MAG: hypothetical protein OXG04_27100 [Acidobacteria bacterium]|nr:hypothetical protein [Acidobacteriota bacterium]